MILSAVMSGPFSKKRSLACASGAGKLLRECTGSLDLFPGPCSASALLGTVQFSAATVASIAVGFFHDGSAGPMSAVIAVCGVLAVLAQRLLVR
jgi:hypothetical protein